MLLENVKGLLSHDGGNTFETMCAVLNDIGYAIDFRILNSKYFGVSQNRERIFIVAKRYDSDADLAEWAITGNDVVAKAKRRAAAMGVMTFNFDWPTNSAVTTRLRDILESNVDERYYLSEEKAANLIRQLSEKEWETIRRVGIAAHDGYNSKISSEGDITPTLTQCAGKFGRNGVNVIDAENPIMVGYLTNKGEGPKISSEYRIRKLTPLECWRLQGFADAQHANVVAAGISDSQRYKQAGNAVTVNVISAIGKRMIPLLDEKKTEVSA